MMSNNKPWQAIVNKSEAVKTAAVKNELVIVKEAPFSKSKPVYFHKMIASKRYSFDDNGGSYQGL